MKQPTERELTTIERNRAKLAKSEFRTIEEAQAYIVWAEIPAIPVCTELGTWTVVRLDVV